MARRRGLRQARRRSHRRLRQDHRPWTCPRSPSTPSLHKAPCGGEGTGPNPTDRAKIGWKWSVATDLFADPYRLGHRRRQPRRLHPARTHPASRRLLLDIETCHLDRGYDSNLTTERCQALGLTDRTLCTLCGLPSSSPPYYRVLISRSWRPAASCGATEP